MCWEGFITGFGLVLGKAGEGQEGGFDLGWMLSGKSIL